MGRLKIEENGYYCEYCNGYNDILSLRCVYCNAYERPAVLQLAAFRTKLARGIIEVLTMAVDNDKIELHAKFFNAERILIRNLDNSQLRSRREELASIILEARAKFNAVDEEERERRAKLSSEGKQWLVTSDSSVSVSDSITGVKERVKRQSKADKLAEAMRSLGLDTADVKTLIGNVENKASEKSINTITFNKAQPLIQSELCRIDKHSDCTGRFTDSKGSHECKCDCHAAREESTDNPIEPFNPSMLSFLKK